MPITPPHPLSYRDSLMSFLQEDWGAGDWSTNSVPDSVKSARVFAKADLVLAGLPIAVELLHLTDASLSVETLANDGDLVKAGMDVMKINGSCRSILMAERVMLNLLQRLSGTASLTRQFVEAIAGTGARILDTRKTTPGLKILEK